MIFIKNLILEVFNPLDMFSINNKYREIDMLKN